MGNMPWMVFESKASWRDGSKRAQHVNRRQTKLALKHMLEGDDDAAVEQKPRLAKRRLGPNTVAIERWLESQIDRAWGEICAELASKVSPRFRQAIIAAADKVVTDGFSHLSLDTQGRLTRAPQVSTRHRQSERPSNVSQEQIKLWLNERMVHASGKRVYWLEISFKPIYSSNPNDTKYRQGREFSARDYRFISRLTTSQQESLLKAGHTYVHGLNEDESDSDYDDEDDLAAA